MALFNKFDIVLYCICFRKSINVHIINIIEHWFSIGTARVRWSDALSEPVPLTAGVRQGGVLSPLLFSTYIDILLSELQKSNIGCYINSKCFNSFLYADDLLLLSNSVTDLQLLFNTVTI